MAVAQEKTTSPNILTQVRWHLRPENRSTLEKIHQIMTENKAVIDDRLEPTLQQTRRYFDRTEKGLTYARNTWEGDVLPSGMIFSEGALVDISSGEQVRRDDFIRYSYNTDTVCISFLHVARQCARYGREDLVIKDSHLPHRTGVRPEDHTTLQIMEECYHKKQIEEAPTPEAAADVSSHEREVDGVVYKQARIALNIELFPIDTELEIEIR